MATLKQIAIPITATATKLYKALDNSTKRLRSFAAGATKTLRNIGAGLGVAGAAITAGVVAAVNKGAESLDKLIKKARSLGIATAELEALRYAGELSGVAAESTDKAFQRMLKTIGDARQGLSTATDALDTIGIKLEDIENLSPSQQFAAIAEAIGKVENQADKTKAALDIFGRSGSDLTNLFSSDIKALIADFEGLNLGITASQERAVEAFNDSKTKLRALFGGFNRQLTAELAGPFTFIIEKITESIKEMGGMRAAASKFAGFVIKGMTLAISAIQRAVDLVLSLQEFMLSTKLLAISLTDTLKASYQSIKNQIPFIEPDTSRSTAGDATAQDLLKVQNLRKDIEDGNSATNKFLEELNAGLKKAFSEGSSDVEQSIKNGFSSGGNTITAAFLKDNPSFAAATGPVDKLASSAEKAAQTLDQVSKSSAWQDIFGKETTTARAADFDEYARLAKFNIESGSQYAQSNIETLKDILRTAINNQGNVFTNEGTFGSVDVAGMQAVIRGLEAIANGANGQMMNPDQIGATKLDDIVSNFGGKVNRFGDSVNRLAETNANQPTLGKLSLDMTTDMGKIAGEIWAEPEFAARLKDFFSRLNNNAARQYSG